MRRANSSCSTNRIATRWDQAKIREGIAVLDEALALNDPGPYQVQAAISALHAEAPTPEATDWRTDRRAL